MEVIRTYGRLNQINTIEIKSRQAKRTKVQGQRYKKVHLMAIAFPKFLKRLQSEIS